MFKSIYYFIKTWYPLLLIAIGVSMIIATVGHFFKLPFAANQFINTIFNSFASVIVAQIAVYRMDLLGRKRSKKHLRYLTVRVYHHLEPTLKQKVSSIEDARFRSQYVDDTLKKDVSDIRQMGLTLGSSSAIPEDVLDAMDNLYRKIFNQGYLYECAEPLQIIVEYFKI